jgi:hypothetical protein
MEKTRYVRSKTSLSFRFCRGALKHHAYRPRAADFITDMVMGGKGPGQ